MSAKEHGLRFIPGWQKQTAMGTPAPFPKHFNWAEAEAVYTKSLSDSDYLRPNCYLWEDGTLHSEPEPLALLPYCDACCRPLTATRDESVRTTVLVCKRCGDRQRVTDCDVAERLSAADFERLLKMVARSHG